MNSLVDFLQDIYNQGWQLWSENGQICYDAPKDKSNDSILVTLKQYKTEILQLLPDSQEKLPQIEVQETDRWQSVVLPLTESQKQLWFLDQLEGNSKLAYVESVYLQLEGVFHIYAMEQAIQKVVERHEALRTRICAGGDFQEVLPSVKIEIPLINFSNFSGSERESQVAEWLEQEIREPFDLSQAPLLRVHILKLEEELHQLVFKIHHIISDGFSVAIILQEIATLYSDQCQRNISQLEPPMLFREYIEGQNKRSQTEEIAVHESYWVEKFSSSVPSLNLPTDRPRPSVMSYRGGRQTLKLDAKLCAELKRVSRQKGCTLFMTLLATYKILLYKLTSDEDIVVGIATAGRDFEGSQNLVAYCAHLLPLRTSLVSTSSYQSLSFSEFLIQMRERLLDDYEHRDYPFSRLLNKLNLKRDPSRPVLVSTLFNLNPRQAPKLLGLKTSLISIPKNFVPYDFFLDTTETEDELLLNLYYSLDLFDDITIKRWLGHFQNLLSAIVENPLAAVGELPLLSEAERHQLLVEWNDTASEYPTDQCIHQLFEQQVERTPQSVAVVFEEEQLTYHQLNQRANQLARHLQTLGVGPQVLVGICTERSVEMVVGLLAILKAGGAYVPLDPNYPQQRLSYMLADSGVEVLLTQQKLLSLPSHTARIVCLDTDCEAISQHSPDNLKLSLCAENLAYIIYTSGSTGQPKGVSIIHQGVVRLVKETNYVRISCQDVFLQLAPISFDASTFEIWGSLLNGAQLVVMPAHPPALEEIAQVIENHNVTVLWLTAALFHLMVEQHLEKLTSVRQLLAGGDVLSPPHVQKVLQVLPQCQLINGYGPTENTTFTCCYRVKQSTANGASVPIGRPIANTQVYILDQQLQPVPIGVSGELYIGGDGLALGYLNRPQLTQEKFIPNPFSNCKSERLYKTGDLARYLSDGNIEFLGRIDNQVKVRGFRIELGEIEAVLNTHPQVQQSVVIATEDFSANKRLVAYVVPEQKNQSEAADPLQSLQIEQWQQVYDDLYSKPVEIEQSSYNTVGWTSSYTGNSIPQEQMRHWVDSTVEQILKWQPKHVLEIGCGTGMLLFQIAPHCLSYCGTDFSEAALGYIEQQIKQLEDGYSHVSLSQKLAHDFTNIEEGKFDAVILNSVVQYFPSINYLVEVLQDAVKTLANGGFIFVGDVRSLPLLEDFHTATQFAHAPNSLTVDQFRQQVKNAINQEEELVIDPDFFLALKQHLPQIKHVQIELKPGDYHNELTKFRYNVTVHVGNEVSSTVTPEWLDYDKDDLNLSAIKRFLLDKKPEVVGIKHIPNARLQEEATLIKELSNSDGRETIGQLRNALQLQTQVGVQPDDLWSLGDELSYEVDITWSGTGGNSCYDAIFLCNESAFGSVRIFPNLEVPNEVKPWSDYANNPLKQESNRHLVLELPNFVRQKLPEYMVPSVFVTLDTLPLTPNGKVDRLALPTPDGEIIRETEYIAPRTQTEEIIANTFASVLSVQAVGIHDNFFSLGGHSLLATQLISRLRAAFSIEIPLRAVFESPTVTRLDQTITQLRTKDTGLSLPPIQPRTHSEQLPLSWAQERLWFLNQLGGASATYNMPGAVRISGQFNIHAFQQALSEIIRRHEVLRTSFQTVNGIPIQVIHPQATTQINVIELQQFPQQERETLLQQLAQQEAINPFDLEIAPLIRCSLLQLDATEFVLLLTMHHIVSDGWSIGVLIQELSSFYQAFCAQQPSPLPELPIQYADFAVWQRQWLSGSVLETQLNYWLSQLHGAPELLQLPTDRPRPSVQTYHGATYNSTLNTDLIQKLQTLSRESGTTLFMTLHAAFATLLYRYSGQSDILVGTPIANRNRSEIESLIGFFVNTLVLRTRFEDNPSFERLLAQVRETTLKAYEHQDVPFEQVVEALQPQRSLSHSPLFQVIFALQNAPMGKLELPGVSLTQLTQESTTAKFDLTLSMSETSQGLVGEWEYNTDLFDGSTIERMAAHFQNLLSALVENPQQLVGELPLLSAAERHQFLVEWNDTASEYPTDKCIHQLFEEQVERTPLSVAVVFNTEQLTYQQLNQQANQLAHHLQSLGVGPEVLVGICVERSIEMVVGLLAILKAGGAYVPLDPNYPQERLSYMLADSDVKVLLTQQSLLESLPQNQAQVVCLDTDWGAIEQHSQDNLGVGVWSDNLAYVIYTSGSTGQPKGILVAHKGLLNLVFWHQATFGITSLDIATQLAGTAFDAAAWELWPYLSAGASIHLLKAETIVQPQVLQDWLILQKITITFVPTPLLESFLSLEWPPSIALRIVLAGGDKLHQYPSTSIPFSVINNYGPTENTVVTTSGLIVSTEQTNLLPPIGRPIANTQIYILDKHLQPVPIGVIGELYIGGDGLARGYLNRPELTLEKFIQNPFSNSKSERLYKTGDLVRYRSDGNIEFLGRIDNQVKVRGFRIELGEIEAVLNTHPYIQQAVVIATEDIPGNKRLVAYMVSDPCREQGEETRSTLTTNQIREFLKQKLPEYMVPSVFVTLDTLPLTPNGKVDQRALPAPNWEILQTEEYVAPRTPTKEIITNIFASVLGIQAVGIHNNFFSLGGHSLLATQLISRLRLAFEVEIPLRAVFEFPTVAQLDQTIAQLRTLEQGLNLPPIEPVVNDIQQFSLSFAQERLWFLNQLEGASATYNIPGAIRITGHLDLNAFQQALSEIVRRHKVLRTSFHIVNDTPIQVIHADAIMNINPVVDLQQLEAIERETVVQQQIQQEAITPFDLETAPLIRYRLLQLDAREYVLLLTMHHIVSDGWSMGVLIQELSSLYQAFCAGEKSPLPELRIQYADFAVWQRQWFSGFVRETQLNYWLSQLHDAPKLLQLPTDRPRPSVQTYYGATQSLTLNTDLMQKLQTLSQESGTTLFMTLLAAFATLLYRYSGQSDILVGTPIANRNRSEIEPLIGFFVNTLVLRTRFEDNPSFEKLLTQVRESTLKAYEHQDVPFEQVVEALQPQRDLSHSPLFQVMFMLQNAPMGELQLPGATWCELNQKRTIAKFDMTLSISETAQGLVGEWEYNIDLFDGSTIERMAAHFQNLLSAIVKNPQQAIDELPLLSAAERHQLLVEWNDTAREYPSDKCIHQLFEQQVEKTPLSVAVVFEKQQLTYLQLNQKANQLAHHLRRLGVGPQVLVGLCVERSIEMVVGLLAILKAGGAYLPLDPTYPQERLSYILEDSGVKVLLTQHSLLEAVPQNQARVICLDTSLGETEQHSHDNLDVGVCSDNLAYVIYTSGSTGQPKGVALAQKSICNYVCSLIRTINVKPSSNFALVSTISADLGNTVIFPSLLTGGCLHVISEEKVFDSNALSEYFSRCHIDYLKIVPSHLAALQSSSNSASVLPRKTLILGGEASSSAWVETIQAQSPNCNIINHYGPTEATVGVLTYFLDKKSLPLSSSTLPIGRPIANTQIYILDKHLQPVPIGVPGELYIGGDGLAVGYLNRPQLTQEKFIANPLCDSKCDRLYKTGDLARYLSDGNIEFLGRIDNQVKVRGFRIELGEIEAVLNTHPQVQQSVVIATEDLSGNKRLVAYVVSLDQSLTSSQIREFLKQKLPEYMVPSAFVTLDTLPLTANGKVDRLALPAPDGEITRVREYVEPRTAIEQSLTNIWQELLLVEKVSIYDNFFEIGGDSILSIQVVSRAKNTGIQITPKQIFQHQTIAELARVANTTVGASAQQGIVTGVAPLTPIQHLFFLENKQEPHHYNQSVLLHLPNNVKPELLTKAVAKLLEHHDALRLRFNLQASEHKQRNHGLDDVVPFSVVDISSTPKHLQPQALSKIATEFQASLNLSDGPIMQVVMFKLDSQGEKRLLIIVHHLAVDGVSWRILLSDLETIYQQLIAQEPIQLTAKTTAFIDWAEKLNNYAQSEIIKQELDYWLNQPWSKTTPLPLDSAYKQENTNASAAEVSVKLSQEETRILLGSVNEAYNTQINDILLSALVVSFKQWTGNSTVVINLEGHGREELFEDVDLSRTVGWFTSLFPVLLQLPSSDQPESVIKSIKEQLRAIPNRGIGYGILRYLCKERTVNQQLQTIPTPEISFNYLGQFDQVQSQTGWKFAPETTGDNHSSKQTRRHLLDVSGLVVEGELQINLTYSKSLHTRATMEKLAQSYVRSIRSIIEHCQLEDAFGYTPSDFPDVQLNQSELDELLELFDE
ncbi:non-ribosomal peptide synthase [Kalymmatonema gypsitolerans NIES-4073]|nr:non-ribosomal peptide synthase [Scytonema sp. NIES-4073]